MVPKKRLRTLSGSFGIALLIIMPTWAGPMVGHRFNVSDDYCADPCKALRHRGFYPYYVPEEAYSGVTPFVNMNDPCEIVYIINDTVQCIVYGGRETKSPFSVETIRGLLKRYSGKTTWQPIPEVGFFEKVEHEFLPIDTSYKKFEITNPKLVAYHGRTFFTHNRFRLTIMTDVFPRLCAQIKKTSGKEMTLADMYLLNDTVSLKQWIEGWYDKSKNRIPTNKYPDKKVQSAAAIVNDYLLRITRPESDGLLENAPHQPYYVLGTSLSIRIATDTLRGDYNNYQNIGLDLTVNNFFPAVDLPGKKILYIDVMRRHELLSFLGNSELCTAYNGDFFKEPDEIEAEKRRLFLSPFIEVHQTGQIAFCAIAAWQFETEPAAVSITFDPLGTRAILTSTTSTSGNNIEYIMDSAGWHLSKILSSWVY